MGITVIIAGVPALVICAGSNFQIETSSSTIALQVFIATERDILRPSHAEHVV